MQHHPACDVLKCVRQFQADLAVHGLAIEVILDPRVPVIFPCPPDHLTSLLRELLDRVRESKNAETLLVYEADDPARRVLRFEIKDTTLGFTLEPEAEPFPIDSPHRALTILVAEDNAANQTLVAGYLQRLGCSCDIVGDGLAAVNAVESKTYDLILMDIHMPRMDGLQATRSIRTLPRGGEPFIAALTAYTMPGHRQECAAAGMNDYLSKPCHLAALAATIDRAARHHAERSNF